MFENTGSKLKVFASIWFTLVLVATVILAFVIAIEEVPASSYYTFLTEKEFHFGVFIAILAGGSVSAYASGLLLAGFGELVENSSLIYGQIYERTKEKDREQAPKPSVDQTKKFAVSAGKKEGQSDYLKRTLERMDKEDR